MIDNNIQPIQKRIVKQYLCSIGKIFASVRTTDPRLNILCRFDFRLVQKIASYACKYPSPSQVTSLPLSTLNFIATTFQGVTPRQQAIIDLVCIVFFFLFQPWEYCQGGTNFVSTPFGIKCVQLYVGGTPLLAITDEPRTCEISRFIILLFTTKNNGLNCKSIIHGNTRHPRVYALAYTQQHVANI